MIVVKQPEGKEYYESAQEFLKEELLIEEDIFIVGLEKKFRIRALTLGQMERINKLATVEGRLDSALFTIYTILEGVIRPRFTKAQVDMLMESSGEVLRELSDQIWMLGRITRKTFDEYLESSVTK